MARPGDMGWTRSRTILRMSGEAGPGGVFGPALAVLDAIGFAYEVLPCPPELADNEAFAPLYGLGLDRIANTILVASRRGPPRHAACVLLATDRLDVNRAVRRRLEVGKASFATPEEATALTGMVPGGVTPFGLPPEVPIWVDPGVLERDWVVFGGGTRTAKVKASPRILEGLPGAEVVPGLVLAPA
jgi:prolyl-tRNA editing enzyme YbaK/EbsC (Cys-tRNA(Pro) deacylase)